MNSKLVIWQLMTCLPAAFIQFLLGVSMVVFVIDRPYSIHILTVARLTMIGPLISALLMDMLGRKFTLLIVLLLYSVFWIYYAFIFIRNTNMQLFAIILLHIGNGMGEVASIVYTSEICTPLFRGIGSGALLAFFSLGHIFVTYIGTNKSYTNLFVVANILIAFIAAGLAYYCTETTYFLTLKGKLEAAKENLLTQPDRNDCDEETEKIREYVMEEREKRRSLQAMLTGANNLKAISISVIWGILHSAVGAHTVNMFTYIISHKFEWENYNVICGILQFAIIVLSLFVIAKINRRSLFIYAFSLIFAGNFCVFVSMYLHQQYHIIDGYHWIMFIAINVNMLAYGFMLPAAYILPSEILPLSVRAVGGGIAIAFQSTTSLITPLISTSVSNNFGMEMNFIMYTLVSAVTIIFIYKVMPETRGKELHNIYEKSDVVKVSI